MAEKPPEQYRVGKAHEFRVRAIPVTPERAAQLRQQKQAALREDQRAAWAEKRRRYLLLGACLAAALGAGVLIGRFLLP
jgi:hypothetical protein